ncbi:Nicastrin [Dendrobium catenatum]|uniref:Nicastrin n=1 Tax=Dendrobium catenatum TaxID=906689 RepID=A0A2I0VYT6_9ASPA|nr:Nicastrin [Dendrobium catenatum]
MLVPLDRALILFIISVLLVVGSFCLVAGETNTLESVPDLEKAMYINVEGYPCVRLLNLSGEIGCSNPGQKKIVAPVFRLGKIDKLLFHSFAVLVPLEELESFLLRHDFVCLFRVSSDPKFAQRIAGVLVEATGFKNRSLGFSPDEKFPQADFAPYPNVSFQWNPRGSGIMWNHYDFPVFLLSDESAKLLQEMATKNENNFKAYPSTVAEFDLVMQTTKAETRDSASCLKKQSCLPLGGYQLVFAVFTGEAWGYLGSRRFLLELELGADSLKGLNGSMIEQVLEIGSVGKGLSEGKTTFFAHSGHDTSSTNEMLDALKKASLSLGSDNVNIKKADVSNPGVPPSSLMSFLRKNSSVSGVVLEDFDTFFINKFYHSHLDDPSNINSSSIAAAAIMVARALYILASDSPHLNLITLNSIKVNVSLVEELVECLLTCEPGFSCDIVKQFISPSNVCPSHYVGVFVDLPSETQHPQYADDTSRFVWNFLADRSSGSQKTAIPCKVDCHNPADVCVAAETESSRCVTSTTRYVPSYSTRLKFEGNSWHILPPNTSDPLGLVDPVWTESYWNTIGLRVYTVQSSAYDNLILLIGIVITVATYITTLVARTFLLKALKHD